MGEQKLRRVAGIALLFQHALEEARHGAGVHAGGGENLHAHPVRLVFVVAGVGQLRLDRRRLGGGDARHAGVAAAGDGQGDARQHGGQHRRAAPFRVHVAACEVPLADVGDFVGDHAGHLVLAGGVQKQAGVEADHPAGHGEGVDGGAVDHHDRQVRFVQLAEGRQPVDQMFRVLLDQRVFHDRRLATKITQPAAPEPVFLLGGNDRHGGVAQFRQILLLGLAQARAQAQQGHKSEARGSDQNGLSLAIRIFRVTMILSRRGVSDNAVMCPIMTAPANGSHHGYQISGCPRSELPAAAAQDPAGVARPAGRCLAGSDGHRRRVGPGHP